MSVFSSERKAPALAGGVLLAAVLLGSTGAGGARAADSGALKIGGTGGALGAMKQLAAAFEAEHPGVSIGIVEHLGTRGGLNAVIRGAIDIGLAGRALRPEERAQGLLEIEYARSPFVFVANAKRTAIDLNHDLIAAIYSGEMRTWADGVPTRLILRPEGEFDTLMLRAMSRP